MITDPIGDFLVRIRNAGLAHKESVSVPSSKMTTALAEVLKREGYISAVSKKKSGPLTLTLAYKDGNPAVQGSKRISKPSRRMYLGIRDIRPVKRGHGLLVLSTPAGVLTGKEAREKKVGGEVLFEIW